MKVLRRRLIPNSILPVVSIRPAPRRKVTLGPELLVWKRMVVILPLLLTMYSILIRIRLLRILKVLTPPVERCELFMIVNYPVSN